ncbi:MAG: 4Fe-4S binding protein [Thermodesulfobacteriota bacterium]
MRHQVELAKALEVFFVKHKRRFPYLHALMFAVFAALIFIPTFLPLPEEGATTTNNFTLFARFAIWGLWFPFILVSVIFFGRIWCGLLCPQGALSEFISRWGLNRPLPKWMRKAWIPMAAFFLITVSGKLLGVDEFPLGAFEILGGTMVLAALVGFLYVKGMRPWCRYLCPVGGLLGVFSRMGAVSFEKTCGDSGTATNRRKHGSERRVMHVAFYNGPERRKSERRTNRKAAICPTFINPLNKSASSYCIECFKCVKNGEQTNSLHLQLRRPGVEIEEIEKRNPSRWEVIFLFAATGLGLGDFHSEVGPLLAKYTSLLGALFGRLGLGEFMNQSGPWWLMMNYPKYGEVLTWLDSIAIITFITAFMFCILLVLYALTSLSALAIDKYRDNLALGYLYAPVALVSLVVGVGGMIFSSLGVFGLGEGAIHAVEAGIFAIGGLWSVILALRLTAHFSKARQAIAMVPNFIGISLVAFLWYEVLF